MHRRNLLVLLTLFALKDAAFAQYPDGPILHMVVPQAAGSATDTLTHVLAAALADELHQQVVVDDRPDGALTLGLDLTAKSPPDGYTLCMGPLGALAITRRLVVPLPYDIERTSNRSRWRCAASFCSRCRRRPLSIPWRS